MNEKNVKFLTSDISTSDVLLFPFDVVNIFKKLSKTYVQWKYKCVKIKCTYYKTFRVLYKNKVDGQVYVADKWEEYLKLRAKCFSKLRHICRHFWSIFFKVEVWRCH